MKKSEMKPGVAPAPPGDGEFSLIPNNKLLDLYAALLKCHLIAKGNRVSLERSLLMSSAVTAGVAIDLLPSDAISPMPSDLTPCVLKIRALKGIALKSLLRWWADPSTRVPKAIANANVIPPVATTAARLEAALRLAAHFRSTNCGSVVVFFAEKHTLRSNPAASHPFPRDLFQSSLHQAAAQRLPILFVRQSEGCDDEDSLNSKHCGVPRMVVDCDDVIAVYRVASEALVHARRGNGPTLIDSKPWSVSGPESKTSGPRNSIGKMELYLAGKRLAFRAVKDKTVKKFSVDSGSGTNGFAG